MCICIYIKYIIHRVTWTLDIFCSYITISTIWQLFLQLIIYTTFWEQWLHWWIESIQLNWTVYVSFLLL